MGLVVYGIIFVGCAIFWYGVISIVWKLASVVFEFNFRFIDSFKIFAGIVSLIIMFLLLAYTGTIK